MNEFVTQTLDARTNPDLTGPEVERIRERLARAGLLAESHPSGLRRPDRAELERAREQAGRGTPLSELISENRR